MQTYRGDIGMIHVGFISTLGRLRQVDPAQVKALAESIREVGLLNPITVYRREIVRNGRPTDGYGLVAGAHRLEACMSLGWSEVPAVVVDLDDDSRIIAECDENLCGSKLSAAEVAMFTAKRKEAYLRLHPETAAGVAGGKRKPGNKITADNLSTAGFADDQAAKTGKAARSVRRDAERGERVCEAAMELVRGTRLDTGRYLDTLKRLAPADQVARVRADLAPPKPARAQPRQPLRQVGGAKPPPEHLSEAEIDRRAPLWRGMRLLQKLREEIGDA